MRWMVMVIVAWGVTALARGGVVAADDVAGMGVKELEGKILESRGAIKSGEFEVRVKSMEAEVERTYHTWLAADGRARQEQTYGGVFQLTILAKDFWYSYGGPWEKLLNPNFLTTVERVPAAQGRAGVAQRTSGAAQYLICDPRAIMFSPGPFSLLSRVDLGTLIGASGRDEIAMKNTEWNGTPAVTVSFRVVKFGNKYEYDVVPGRGFNIVAWRLTGTYPIGGGGVRNFSENLSCELNEISPNVWFPKRVVSKSVQERWSNVEEEWTVVARGVNGDVPAEVFSVGWKLPPKRLLLEGSRMLSGLQGQSGSVMYWDGKQVRAVTRKEENAQRESRLKSLQQLGASRGMSGRTLVWIGVGSLIAVALGLAVMIWATRRGQMLDLTAAVSLLLCVAVGVVWGRSYWKLDEAFVVYSVDGSEQVGVMRGKVLFQHREPDEGIRGRLLRVSVRSTAVSSLPPRYWPPLEKGKTVWPGAVTLQVAAPGDVYRGLAFPIWHVGILFIVLPGVWLAARAKRLWRRQEGKCGGCGYDLRGNSSGVCPECGRRVAKESRDMRGVDHVSA